MVVVKKTDVAIGPFQNGNITDDGCSGGKGVAECRGGCWDLSGRK